MSWFPFLTKLEARKAVQVKALPNLLVEDDARPIVVAEESNNVRRRLTECGEVVFECRLGFS